MTKTKTKWHCIYTPPFEKDREKHGGDYYAGQRLFISDDPRRIFVVDNSGDDPDEVDDGPIEIDLSVPGVLTEHWQGDDRLPYGATFATKCERTVTVFPWEGVILLVEKWGASLYSRLTDETLAQIELLAKAVALAEKAPTCSLAVCENKVRRGRTMCRECSPDLCGYGECDKNSIRGSEWCEKHSE